MPGHFPDPKLPTWEVDGRLHLYTGESYALRERLAQHLLGGLDDSNVRESLLAIQWIAGALPSPLADMTDRTATEHALTSWLKSQVVIGYKVCGYGKAVERAMLERTVSALNIADRPPSPFSRLLSNYRKRFNEAVVSGWAPPPPKLRQKRRH